MTLIECVVAIVVTLLAIGLLCVAIAVAPLISTYTLAVAKASWQMTGPVAVPILRVVSPFAVFVTTFVLAAHTQPSPESNP